MTSGILYRLAETYRHAPAKLFIMAGINDLIDGCFKRYGRKKPWNDHPTGENNLSNKQYIHTKHLAG